MDPPNQKKLISALNSLWCLFRILQVFLMYKLYTYKVGVDKKLKRDVRPNHGVARVLKKV